MKGSLVPHMRRKSRCWILLLSIILGVTEKSQGRSSDFIPKPLKKNESLTDSRIGALVYWC